MGFGVIRSRGRRNIFRINVGGRMDMRAGSMGLGIGGFGWLFISLD